MNQSEDLWQITKLVKQRYGRTKDEYQKELAWLAYGVPILTRRKRTLRDFNHVEALCLLTFSLKSFNFIDGKNTP